jgi:CubicO group peptidase (beta-lactamase class C family)
MKKLILLLALPLGLQAQKTDPGVEQRIRQVETMLAPPVVYGGTELPNWKIEDRMKVHQVKGLSIAVIRNGKIDWAKGYGWADEAEHRPVTTTTRFQAASISKSLNSLGILKLVQQGKIDPEADINNYLKGWQFPYDSLSKGKKINLYNLLSHTGGLTVHGFGGYERQDRIPTIPEILDGKAPANSPAVRSLYEPGLKHEYSGGGTTISQLMLTSVTGRRYEEYMQKEVLTPLGMSHSSFAQPNPDTAELATGYYNNGKTVPGKYHVYPEQAAAGLWTTPSDLARYIIECQQAWAGKSSKVLSPEMMRKRLTPYVDTNAALGCFIIHRGGDTYFNHNGGNEAFLSTSYGNLNNGDGVVIMINGEDFGVIAELLNSVCRVYGWKGFYKPEFRKRIELTKAEQDAMLGRYTLDKDTFYLKSCDGGLCLNPGAEGGMDYHLVFSETDRFSVVEAPDAQFHVLYDDNKKVAGLEMKQRARTVIWKRIN